MRTRRHRQLGVVTIALFVMTIEGCASASMRQETAGFKLDAAGTRSEGALTSKVGGARLTSAQLASTNAWWTADAVNRLRPDFLRGTARSPRLSGRTEIALYLNGTRAGDASMLNTIPLREVREIVFLRPMEARIQLGSSCPCADGAILVTTRATPEE